MLMGAREARAGGPMWPCPQQQQAAQGRTCCTVPPAKTTPEGKIERCTFIPAKIAHVRLYDRPVYARARAQIQNSAPTARRAEKDERCTNAASRYRPVTPPKMPYHRLAAVRSAPFPPGFQCTSQKQRGRYLVCQHASSYSFPQRSSGSLVNACRRVW